MIFDVLYGTFNLFAFLTFWNEPCKNVADQEMVERLAKTFYIEECESVKKCEFRKYFYEKIY